MKQPYSDKSGYRPGQHGYGTSQPHAGQIPSTWLANRTYGEEIPRDLILIIEDSVAVRTIIEVSLRRGGYRSMSFADGVNALRWLHQQTTLPALLLLDLGLPHLDGFEILHLLRGQPRWQTLPVVILTGRNGVIDRVKGRVAGAQEYLTKPFLVRNLLSVVQETLHRAQPLPIDQPKLSY
jgi:twitching motility two-component system response regulator PilG